MRVLVSNDDGVDAPGIQALAKGLRDAGHEVLVVAPDRDRSGASNSLTLDLPIRTRQIDERTIRVNGTPTDCVHLGLNGLLEETPDMVVAGINLPMLIRLESARKAMTVVAAVAAAREAGRKYISVASEVLGEAAA